MEKPTKNLHKKHVTENYPVKNLWILQGLKISLKTFSIYLELSGGKTVKELTCEKRKYELTDSKPLKKKCEKACINHNNVVSNIGRFL